jgi:hypothetical protein
MKIFEELICCKQETVNSVIKTYVVPHNFIRTHEGLFCEGAENYAVNEPRHILNDDDDDEGRQICGINYHLHLYSSSTLCMFHHNFLLYIFLLPLLNSGVVI